MRSPFLSLPTQQVVQFALVVLAASAATYSIRAANALQDGIQRGLALSDNQMGLLQGPAMAIPVVVMSIPLGSLVDRYSRAKLVCVLSLVDACASLIIVRVESFAELLLARSLVGLVTAGITVASYSLLADLFAPVHRGRAKAFVVIGQYVGASLAFSAGGKLLEHFGSEYGWRDAMFWLTAPPLFLASLITFAMREPHRSSVAERPSSASASLLELWRYRATVGSLIFAVVLSELPVAVVMTWSGPTFVRTFNVTPAVSGAILGGIALISGILGPAVGGLTADLCHRRGGPRMTMTVLAVVVSSALAAAFFPLVPNLNLAIALLGLFATAMAASVAMGVTLFTIVVPNELRGLGLSILAAAGMLVSVGLGTIAVSVLSSGLGGPLMLGKAVAAVLAASCLLCVWVCIAGRRHLPVMSQLATNL